MSSHQLNNMTFDYLLPPMTSPSAFPMSGNNTEESAAGPSSLVHRRRSSGGVGGRKRSPDSLISPDAPTQARKYVTPSATSKKEVPAFFAKRYPFSQASDDEEDELTEEPPSANATDQEKIEWRRRQNTLAARRSRKRKLMQQQYLEETVERLTREKEVWRTRALTLKQLLHSHGILCPDFKD